MARKTVAEMQALLDGVSKDNSQKTRKGMLVLKRQVADTLDYWFVLGGVDYPGKARWCRTTVANDDNTQRNAITTALAA